MERGRSFLVNCALVFSSLTLCFVLFEVVLRIISYGDAPVRTLRNVDPVDNLAFLPNSKAHYKTDEFDFYIRANEFGRRDENWSREQITDTSNVLFIGDSFVMGSGVIDKNTMPTLLEQLYEENGADKEVFNFGMAGSVAFPEYKKFLLRAFDLGIKAKTVVVGIFIGNDFSRGSIVIDNFTTGQF